MARKRAKEETGLESGPDGADIGRDPRRLSPDVLRALGHRAAALVQVMRRRCVDCCGGKTDEVRRCTAVACPLWPYRMGTDPWRAVRAQASVDPAAARPAASPPEAAPSSAPSPVGGNKLTQRENAASPAEASSITVEMSVSPRKPQRRCHAAMPRLPLFEDSDTP